jgi:hypothetical protein
MNIFAIHDSPYLAARDQHDRHVIKMTLETAQLLSTAVWHQPWIRNLWSTCHRFDIRPDWDHVESGSLRLYRSISNPGHASAVWTRASRANLAWTICHLDGLISEYSRRFGKVHACETIRISFLPVLAALADVDRVWIRNEERKLIVHPDILALADSHDAFAVCMPDIYKSSDPIDSYRTFYLEEKIFQSNVKWTKCESIPAFIADIADPDTIASDRIRARVIDLLRHHAIQSAPAPIREVAKPFVPTGMGVPAFLRRPA